MISVLLVAPYGGVPGGISRWTSHIMDYYELIGKSDCSLTLVPMGRTSFVNINSPTIYRLKEAWRDYFRIFRDFNQKLRGDKYHVMHLTSSASWSLLKDICFIRAAKRRGIKTVIHFRFGRIPALGMSKNWEWRLLIKVLKLVDLAIVLDEQSLTVLEKNGFSNVVCLPNPISPEVQTIVEQSHVARIPRSLLFCGHVVKTKGVFELIDACRHIPGIHLKMVGYVADEMRTEINEYSNSAPWLELSGEVPYAQVIKEMMASDIMVLPSYTEGFPNVILEGMAAGCVIVATDVGAIAQILEEEGGEKYGAIVNPKDVDALRLAIISFLDSSDEKEQIRIRVKSRVHERYSMQAVWKEMVSLWYSLIDE